LGNDHNLTIPDAFPLSPGHTLIIPKRHIASLFEAIREEQTAMFDLVSPESKVEGRTGLMPSP